MDDKNEKKFIWGNYDYSNNTNNNNNSSNNSNEENDNYSIKEKIKEGIGKIKPSKLYNKIKNKFNSNNDENEQNEKNKSGIVNYTPKIDDDIDDDSDYQISCLIDDYKDRVIGKEHVIFYKIELTSSLSGKKWVIYHSFQEFNDLYLIYQKLFLDVPTIKWTNSKTIIKEPILHRELISQLHNFVNDLLKKPALLSSQFLVDFLELQNHFSDIGIYKPLLRYDSNYDDMYSNNLCINTVVFLEESKLLLIGTGLGKDEKNVENNNNDGSTTSKYFGFVKKIGNFFKKDKDDTINTCRGKFYIYNIIRNNNGEIMVVELHCLEVISEIVKIEFWQETNVVTLGLNNGQILIFKLYIKELNISSKEIIEYIGTINYHTTPTLSCIINVKEGYSYTFAQHETGVKICELNYQTLVKEFSIYNNDNYKKNKKNKGIICVDYTISFEYIYIQDDEGTIFFIDIISDPLNPFIVSYFPKFLKGTITFDEERNTGKIIQIKNSYYLFVGETDLENKKKKNKYVINIYLIYINENSYNNNETIQLIKLKEIYLYGLINITNIIVNNKDDIIISLSNGSICIYNHLYNMPEYIIPYHYQKLTNFIWYEKQKSIISVSLDKTIKIYQLPIKWPAEFIRKNKEINETNIIRNIIQETKYIYYNNSSNYLNSNNNNDEENDDNNNGNDKGNIGKNYGNIWDVGNLDSRNIINKNVNNKDKSNIDEKMYISNNNNILNIYNLNDKKDKTYYNDDIKNENDIIDDNYEKNIRFKIEKYEEYFNIFSDDLDGWSNMNIELK